jgi:hypothetical protein
MENDDLEKSVSIVSLALLLITFLCGILDSL